MGSPIDPAIQRLLDGWLEAVQAGDVAAIVRHYSDDVLAFDAVAQLQFVGREAYAQHWRTCLQACQQTRFERHHLAVEQGCGRFEWSVLDWNTPSIDFDRRLGAVGMDEWTTQRMDGEALHALATHPES